MVCGGAVAFLLVFGITPIPEQPQRPVPVAPVAAAPLDLDKMRISERIASLSLEQKIAQLMVVHCPGQDAAAAANCLSSTGASGVILMADNIGPSPDAVAALTAALPNDPVFATLVAIDEEGGEVTRLPWDTLPGGAALAAAPAAETSAAFAARAGMLTAIGANVNFGVVADVTDDPHSFLYDRVLGHDPVSASERVVAAVTAEGAVASTLKHFPGHGAASGNSHSQLPVAELSAADWASGPVLPFQAGIDSGAELVMMAHIVVPVVDGAPASLSAVWHSKLRELGFDGVIISDDLLMLEHNGLPEFADRTSNALRSLQAGTDLLLWVGSDGLDVVRAGLLAAVVDGRLAESRIDESLERVLRLRLTL